MGAPILVQVKLDMREIERGGQLIARTANNALDAGTAASRQHAQRLEAIARLSAENLRQIEARRQAQIDAIRERGLQRALEHERKIQREAQRSSNAFDLTRASISRLSGAFAALAAVGIVSLFERFGRAALDAAISVDQQVNTLKALTGSAEQAQRRFAELIAIAQRTPGLTTGLAATLDTQLRILNVTQQTIDKLLPAIGRLNAISPLGDPARFVGNLTQLITQGFERQDLKELVGNSPFAGELIKEIFNVDSPTNAKAIRESAARLGIRTFEDFAEAFVKTAENNPRLAAVTESLGTQFEKLRDRLTVAIAPVGEQIAKTLLPVFDELIRSVETYGSSAADVFRENKNDIIAATQQISKMVVEIGKAVFALGELAVKLQIPEVLGRAAAEFQDIVDSNGANLFTFEKGPKLLAFERQLALIEAERKLPRLSTEPGVTSGLIDTIKGIADFNSRNRRRLAGGAEGGGSAGTTGRSRRDRFINDFGLSDATLLEREAELARIRLSNQAVVERRERELLATQRPSQIAGFNAALSERIRLTELETLRLEQNTRAQAAAELQRTSRRAFNRSGAFIEDALNRGQVTGGEAELLRQGAARDFANQLREVLAVKEQLLKVDDPLLDDLRDEIELYDRLGTSISNSERFLRGFNSATESVGDAFERFGQNVSRAFTNVRDLFNGLKQAVLGFFNDLLGQSLQNLMGQFLAPALGGIARAFGGPSFAGAAGNIFRTPSTFPAAIAQAFAGAGGGITAPPSISSSISQFIGAGVPRTAGVVRGGIDEFIGASVPRTAGRVGGFFSNIGQSLAAAAPLVGLSFGSSLGGQSVLGQIAGSAGGLLGGGLLAAKLAPSLLSKGAAAFFTNPITAIVGAGLLVGSIFLGKAAQRRKDEEASGQMLTQALQGIEQLAAGISSDQIEGSQARGIFDTQILGVFKQQISGLKTKSVVESRLRNQVRDLENVYQSRITPLIEDQNKRRADQSRFAAIDRRLIPQFAIGGVSSGGLAILHPNEMVLTPQHQAMLRFIGGRDVFERIGVPGVQQKPVFDRGGVMPAGSGGATIVIDNLFIGYGMSQSGAEEIFLAGGRGRNGEQLVINHIENARLRGRNI